MRQHGPHAHSPKASVIRCQSVGSLTGTARADARGAGGDAERLRVIAERGAPFGGREHLLLHTSLFTTQSSFRSTESTDCPVLRYSLPSPLTRSTANTLQHSVRDVAHDRHVSITQSRSATCRRQQQNPVRSVSR